MPLMFVFIHYKMLQSTIDIKIVPYFHVISTPPGHLTAWIIGLYSLSVPVLIVRLLSYWYNTQLFYVKWADKASCDFKTTNGVRQGGILSPRLFSLYIDELSDRLSKSNVGCFIDGTCMNHFFYADDICILAPSAISLQELINICAPYGEEHDILYNPLKCKSKCMIIKPNG